jgi:hypothetical protein
MIKLFLEKGKQKSKWIFPITEKGRIPQLGFPISMSVFIPSQNISKGFTKE